MQMTAVPLPSNSAFQTSGKMCVTVNVICLYLSVWGHNQTIFSWRFQRFRSWEENFNVCCNDKGFKSHTGNHKDRYVPHSLRTILLEHNVSFKVKLYSFSSGIERSCCALCQQQKAKSENICYFSHSRQKEEYQTKTPCIKTRVKFCFKVRNKLVTSSLKFIHDLAILTRLQSIYYNSFVKKWHRSGLFYFWIFSYGFVNAIKFYI